MLAKTKKTLEWAIFSFFGLIIVLCGSLLFYQVTYANKIYRNVYVADIDLSGKTKAQALSIINKSLNDQLEKEVTLVAGDKELKTKVSDTGLLLDTNQIVDLCFKAGRSNNFFEQLTDSAKTLGKKTQIPVKTEIDQKKYDDFLAIAVAQFNSNPVDASLTVSAGQIKEVAEQEGSVVNTDSLPEKILGLSHEKSDNIIILDVEKTAPAIKITDFANTKIEAEAILAKKIQLSYENKTYTPSRTEIGNWIIFSNKSGDIIVSLSDGNIQAYLNKIAADFEIKKKDKKINAADGAILEEGQEGRALDKTSVILQIKNQIKNQNNIQIAMQTNVVPISEVKIYPAEGVVAGRFPGKYIDITLASQKLCTIEGENILNCFTVSSGKPSMPTPKGTYAIQNKNPRAWSSKYGLYMPYWQAFNGAYGIHELPEWPGGYKEGQDHLGTPVSHGCVRLGIGDAASVYGWTDIGTPVYIH